jgi:hypothetical protein
MESADPLELLARNRVVAHWGFVYDTDRSWVTGELLLRSDGILLRRYGGSRYQDGATTYTFGTWERVPWWNGVVDREVALSQLKTRGYSVTLPGPTAIEVSTAGPFPGAPATATYL